MRRVSGIVSALAVSFFAILPVSAWDRYSFVDSDKYYSYTPVMQSAAASDSLSASSSSLSGSDLFTFPSLSGGVRLSVSSEYLPSVELIGAYPEGGVSFSPDSSRSVFLTTSVSVPAKVSGYDVQGVGVPVFMPYDYGFTVDEALSPPDFVDLPVDISTLGDFSSFSLSGKFTVASWLGRGPGTSQILCWGYPYQIQIFVNGLSEYTLNLPGNNANIRFPLYLYTGSSSVSSVVIRVHFTRSFISYSDIPSPLYAGLSLQPQPDFTLTTLSGSAINDAVNEEGQDAIDQEDALQSEWGGSMVENFNDLNIGSFTYPSGLTSAFSLVSGIFQDIWYAFDDYAVLWVFPLTLAILLLVVGRLSKFAGRSSKDDGDG